jgi:hypothetical protein
MHLRKMGGLRREGLRAMPKSYREFDTRWRATRAALVAGTLAGLIAFPAAPLTANDSTASLDAGGLRLTYNPDIRVESEDLSLSRSEVRVVYRFNNTSKSEVSTLVAFPLPVMEIGEGGNYAIQDRDPINVMDFQVTVDGRRVDPSVQVTATRFGVDVTAVLNRHAIPLTIQGFDGTAGKALFDRLNTLPGEAQRELERYGVIDWTTIFDDDHKPQANLHWDAHITFYWFQTFPAGRTIEVTHRYRPVPRQFFVTNAELTSAETQKVYCIDPAFVRAAGARLQQSPQNALAGYELKYVLTTAGNWLGPIQKFRLTVQKSSPDALVTWCAKNIKRSSPTTFTLSQENYSPDEDLKILFVEPIHQDK